ncbi:MAG: hypothetical protein RJQ21_08520 [Rhodospirillales bacterium]
MKTVTFAGHGQPPGNRIARVLLESLSGGYSAAATFRMRAFAANGQECSKAVIKFGPVDIIAKESENYSFYVQWYLPGRLRPERLGTLYSAKMGALVYSFVDDTNGELSTLATYMSAGDYPFLNRRCRKSST